MKVEKAGCILIDKKSNKIGLIYRKKQQDYSFPKGHRELNETLVECAIRETAEETKRNCILYSNEPVAKEHYYDLKNDEVDMYYYIAIDNVEKTLSYDSLRKIWLQAKEIVLKIMDNKN